MLARNRPRSRRSGLAALGALAASLAVGCNPTADKAAIEAVGERLYALIKAKDFDGAAGLYDERFFQATPRAEWIELLGSVTKKLGDLQKQELVNWRLREFTGVGTANPSGTYGELQYKTTYAKHEASEALSVFKPKSGDGGYRITGHKINSNGLLKE